jgi:hypothetical protein
MFIILQANVNAPESIYLNGFDRAFLSFMRFSYT